MSNLSEKELILKSREIVMQILWEYENSTTSVRSIIRDSLSKDNYQSDIAGVVQILALGVVRYFNTINYLIQKALRKFKVKITANSEMNQLRIALFEGRWLKKPLKDIGINIQGKDFTKILKDAIKFPLKSKIQHFDTKGKFSLLYSHPSFLIDQMIRNIGKEETKKLLAANNNTGSTYLRFNQLLNNKETILKYFKDNNVKLTLDSDISFLYRVESGLENIINSNFFRNGSVFIQDKASVHAVEILKPTTKKIIWDACAAPGMKTHLIWELMKGTGTLVASDLNYNRLLDARNRFELFNSKGVSFINTDAVLSIIQNANKILIDAPCTSTGIIQTHPSYKWRLNKEWLFSIMTIQNKILDSIISNYSNKPGTEIVYSTCSILPHEGENQIDSMLEKYPIELIPIKTFGSKGYSNYNCTNEVCRLFPHKHQTNGFFIAHLKII